MTAIVITIMVPEMKVPHGDCGRLAPTCADLAQLFLSFAYVGVYWNNHHHMLHACSPVTGAMLWANLHLLFWLSLFPITTGWVGKNHFIAAPPRSMAWCCWMAAITYYVLQQAIIRAQGHD